LNNNSFRNWWGIVFIVMIASVIIVGCDQGETASVPESIPADTEGTEETLVSKKPKGHAIGEEIKFLEWINLTVTNVERSKGNERSRPRTGSEYIIVTVKIDNIGKENFQYESYSFGLVNSQGKNINEDSGSLIDAGTYLQPGELKPGESVTGTITFQQPIGEQGLQVKFQSRYAEMPSARIDIP
jgi:hypothetical protein